MKRILDENERTEALRLLEEMHPEAACALNHRSKFELIVAVVLSAQTTDVSVNKVTPALFEKYPDAKSLAAADPADVAEIIRTIGLYKNKSVNIVRLAERRCSEYGTEVPGSFDELVSLPGVGRKSANLILGDIYGQESYVCDTHCIRLSGRIGLSDGSKDPFKVEMQLRKIVPPEESGGLCHRLVDHGRAVCKAQSPQCDACCLNDICRKQL